jgi:hypothetical protein
MMAAPADCRVNFAKRIFGKRLEIRGQIGSTGTIGRAMA